MIWFLFVIDLLALNEISLDAGKKCEIILPNKYQLLYVKTYLGAREIRKLFLEFLDIDFNANDLIPDSLIACIISIA